MFMDKENLCVEVLRFNSVLLFFVCVYVPEQLGHAHWRSMCGATIVAVKSQWFSVIVSVVTASFVFPSMDCQTEVESQSSVCLSSQHVHALRAQIHVCLCFRLCSKGDASFTLVSYGLASRGSKPCLPGSRLG